jgi:uncharacterized membrane protein YsdA (DUF1294 family)
VIDLYAFAVAAIRHYEATGEKWRARRIALWLVDSRRVGA